MITKNNIPAGYKDSAVGIIPQEWKVKRLGTCFSIGHGRDYKHLPNGDIPVYGSGGIICYVGSFLHNGETVCIGRKGTINKPFYYNGSIWTVDTLFYTHNFQSVLPRYVGYLFDSIDWMRYNEATGVPSLTAKTISNIKKAVPPMEEQRKIAEILGVWDEAIEKQSRLIEMLELRKRALMQRLLTGRTRLPGFTTPWQKVKFKQIFEKKNITLGANNTALEVLSVTKEGIVSQKEYFNKDIASEDISKYLLVEKGDLAMSGLNFWMGSYHILTKYDKGIISPAYKVFKVSKIYNLPFMIHFVKSHTFKYSLVGCSVIGASIVRRNLDKEMLDEWCYLIPSLPEQKAIAEVLTTADDEIATHRKKLDALRLQKRGLMQQLLIGKTRVKI